ncbi:uncharacterized protein [Rhodnius prolixus]|uniref:Putative secreted protein n=1 Tax=Rhodnius neglectus TaxID=72488 RepID=A0A0P4VL54_9HEMI
MKHLIILFSTLFAAQGLTQEELPLKNTFEHELQEALGTLFEEYQKLTNFIDESTKHQAVQQISSQALAERVSRLPAHCLPDEFPLTETWYEEACEHLVKNLAKGTRLARRVSDWAYQSGLQFVGKCVHLIQCININPVATINCVKSDVQDLKTLVADLKNDALRLKDEIVELGGDLKGDFKNCFGEESKVQALTQQMVVQAELCNDLNSVEQ